MSPASPLSLNLSQHQGLYSENAEFVTKGNLSACSFSVVIKGENLHLVVYSLDVLFFHGIGTLNSPNLSMFYSL